MSIKTLIITAFICKMNFISAYAQLCLESFSSIRNNFYNIKYEGTLKSNTYSASSYSHNTRLSYDINNSYYLYSELKITRSNFRINTKESHLYNHIPVKSSKSGFGINELYIGIEKPIKNSSSILPSVFTGIGFVVPLGPASILDNITMPHGSVKFEEVEENEYIGYFYSFPDQNFYFNPIINIGAKATKKIRDSISMSLFFSLSANFTEIYNINSEYWLPSDNNYNGIEKIIIYSKGNYIETGVSVLFLLRK